MTSQNSEKGYNGPETGAPRGGAFARTFTIIMTPAHTAVALALLAGAAAIQCPDASWFAFEDKCYSAQARASTHAGCATICGGSNASLVHIESQDENDFVRFLADDNSWIGYYKVMSPKGDGDGFWGRWTSSDAKSSYTNWYAQVPDDYCVLDALV